MKPIYLLVTLLASSLAFAETRAGDLLPQTSHTPTPNRYLASGNADDDLTHYRELSRRLGVDLGLLSPLGDFQKEFGSAPAFGVHFTWEAIPPFGLVVGVLRSASSDKGGAASGKLSVTSIDLGTQASFAYGRFAPFIQFGGSFLFNDVSFNAARTVTSGNDTNLTTVGIKVGIGIDFIVGREVSFGLDANYYYCVPKKVSTTTTDFDLGSSFVTGGIRMNF